MAKKTRKNSEHVVWDTCTYFLPCKGRTHKYAWKNRTDQSKFLSYFLESVLNIVCTEQYCSLFLTNAAQHNRVEISKVTLDLCSCSLGQDATQTGFKNLTKAFFCLQQADDFSLLPYFPFEKEIYFKLFLSLLDIGSYFPRENLHCRSEGKVKVKLLAITPQPSSFCLQRNLLHRVCKWTQRVLWKVGLECSNGSLHKLIWKIIKSYRVPLLISLLNSLKFGEANLPSLGFLGKEMCSKALVTTLKCLWLWSLLLIVATWKNPGITGKKDSQSSLSISWNEVVIQNVRHLHSADKDSWARQHNTPGCNQTGNLGLLEHQPARKWAHLWSLPTAVNA